METQKQLAKVELKRKIINYKAEKLSRTIDDITEVDEDNDDQKTFAELMSNDQIRENLEEGRIWRKISDAIYNEMNDLLIEAAGLPIQVRDFEEMESKVKIAETKVENAIKILKKVYKKRGNLSCQFAADDGVPGVKDLLKFKENTYN